MTLRIIGGTLQGRLIKTPSGTQTRPSLAIVRKALFDICQQKIHGAHFLDLFAGSGAMGIEAISRGAAHALFVEKDRYALKCIRENLISLQIEPQAEVMLSDAFAALKKLSRRNARFDILYLDPPYALAERLLPDLLTFIATHDLMNSEGLLFVEEPAPPTLPLHTLALSSLSYLNQRRFGQAVLTQFRKNT